MGLALMGRDLADYSSQHVFFCRQNLVAAGGRADGCGIYRRTICSHFCADGNYFPGGATLSGLHRVEIPGAAFRRLRWIIRTAISRLEIVWTVLTTVSVRRIESDGQQRVGEPAL